MATVQLFVSVLALVGGVQCFTSCGGEKDADVLILGAGMAGLGAAEVLSQNGIDDFLIIDQLDRIGGRVQTETFEGSNVEFGPQWIFTVDFSAPEEMQNPLIPLIRRCNITFRELPVGGLPSVFYDSNGNDITATVQRMQGEYNAALTSDTVESVLSGLHEEADIPFSAGLRAGGWIARTPLEEHVEYIAFDTPLSRPTDTASYRYYVDPLVTRLRLFQFGFTPANFAITDPRGVTAFPQCVADQYLDEDDPRLILETTVTEVIWDDDCVCVMTSDSRRYCASYAIITFSIGALQDGVKFTPELPSVKQLSINHLEMANFLKIYASFESTFWDVDSDFIFYFDEINGREYYPFFQPWGSYLPGQPPILEAFLTGDTAKRVAYQDLEITRQQIGEVMKNIYGELASDPINITMHDFIVNPYFYGDFVAAVTGVSEREIDEISAPISNLYFSGEALSFLASATIHGPLIHGRQTAQRIVDRIQGPLQVFFVNDSPRMENDSISAEFRISKPASSIDCILVGEGTRTDCSSGQVTFSDLEDGQHQLRIVARIAGEERERAAESRILTTGSRNCAVHLINAGVSITGSRASVEFSSSGAPASGFQCRLNDGSTEDCSSPLVLRNLPSGSHRLQIVPVCEAKSVRHVVNFDIASLF